VDGVSRDFAAYIAAMVSRGGPQSSEYGEITNWIACFDAAKRAGRVTAEQECHVMSSFGEAVSLDTVQGFVYQRPHGYAGDYEVIDRIYTHWLSPMEHLRAWDEYFHAQAVPHAVRNRKEFLHTLLDQLADGAQVLNLGSGPGRCMLEWFDRNPSREIHIDCVDMDSNAIGYAQSLNSRHLDRIRFSCQNVLRLRTERRYDLIWAAGLFDYFRDSTFVGVVKRLLPALDDGGRVVIGNFSVDNPTRAYMELGGWCLNHRTPEQLLELMGHAGLRAVVDAEPEGVNLFTMGTRA